MSTKSEFHPFKALILYGLSDEYRKDSVYLEIADIEKVNGEFSMKAGKPLTIDAYKKLLSLAISSDDTKTKIFKNPIIDPRIISFTPIEPFRYICWYEPAMLRSIEIKTRETKHYTIFMPAILYLVKNGNLQIYALINNKRPDLNTKLYQMPLPNLNSSATFCWGNIKVEKLTESNYIDEELDGWMKAVWNTQFDSYNIGGQMKLYDSLNKSKKRFPKSELKSLNKTLNDIL